MSFRSGKRASVPLKIRLCKANVVSRVAQHVVEVEMRQTLSVRETVGMQHDECAKLFGLGEEWAVSRIRQFPPIDVGQNLNTLQFQVRYDIIELAHGQPRL